MMTLTFLFHPSGYALAQSSRKEKIKKPLIRVDYKVSTTGSIGQMSLESFILR